MWPELFSRCFEVITLKFSRGISTTLKSYVSLHLFIYLIALRERNPLFVLGVLCIIGYPVQLIKDFFSRLHLCRHTFSSLWGDCLRFVSHWSTNSRGDSSVPGVHFSNVFWDLLFVFVFVTSFKSFPKVYYRPVFIESSKVVFWKCVRLLVHASMKPSCVARRPLCLIK